MKEQMTVEHLGGLPLISIEPTNPKSWQFAVKYAIDRVAAAFLIILLSPVLIAIAIAVRYSLGAPILYRQIRIGRDGKEFEMLKFRSMSAESELPIRELLKLPSDMAPGGIEGVDRRSTVGQILRRTSLDELPQLLNVVRGDMSLVGPRPERPEYAAVFEREVHRYGERHRVRAGITGWAQVHGLRGKTSLADRAEWDNYYIDNWSLWLDFKILLLTLRSLVRFRAE
jgi:lipopolysaccharide/colanic/teichoic acid biosynthesis glycosyltransferase